MLFITAIGRVSRKTTIYRDVKARDHMGEYECSACRDGNHGYDAGRPKIEPAKERTAQS